MRHICRLREPNRDALVLYARFIGNSVDYVLNQLIETTLLKDREFVTWRQEHPNEVATPTARGLFTTTSCVLVDRLGMRP